MNEPTNQPSDRADESPLPPRPRVVLRVGFAGRRSLSAEEETRLESALRSVFQTLGRRLAAIAPGVPVDAGKEPKVSEFYGRECPLLRLVTGLCEGADAVAARVLEEVSIAPDGPAAPGKETRCLEAELAAVIPFDVETYRSSRPTVFQREFDKQLARCAYVCALDGIYDKPAPDTCSAKNRRARAYRAQAAVLLRQCDLLVAATDPEDAGKAGGTIETIREAMAFELPVVLIHTGTGDVHLIEPEEDLPSLLAQKAPSPSDREDRLSFWVTQLTTAADASLDSSAGGRGRRESFLVEFFDRPAMPPRNARTKKRKKSLREKIWSWFESLFRSGVRPKSDPSLAPYLVYRRRATDLNYHYSGLYRGAFLLNYFLAIAAVTLAAVSLVLLGIAAYADSGGEIVPLAGPSERQAAHPEAATNPAVWLLPTLLLSAVAKVILLSYIAHNTRSANREGWNDRAVDYRYLAERLRGMYYLPRAGSHQPPGAAPPRFASRAVRQSAADWLFEATVRSVSPADLPFARPAVVPTYDGRGNVSVKKLLTYDPLEITKSVRDEWITEQQKYHDGNALTMRAMHGVMERAGEFLSGAVIVVVGIDLILVGGEWLHLLPGPWERWTRPATPWLIFVSAILPAVVASLNGIRFQSECLRLAERSAVMKTLLLGGTPAGREGRWKLANNLAGLIDAAKRAPATDPGCWSHDALRLTERVAADFVEETAEWSVLYAKEIAGPG